MVTVGRCWGRERAIAGPSSRRQRAHRDANIENVFYYAVFFP